MGIDAATLGQIGVGAQALGGGMAVIGAYNKSKAEKYAAEYQAQVQANNAQLAQWKAQDAITRGQTEVARQQLKTRQLKGAQRASMAARGIDLGEGSALNILTDTDLMGAVDANTLADNASKEAWALRNEAAGASANAGLLRDRAGSVNPFMDAAGTALTAGGAVASSWYKLNKDNMGLPAKGKSRPSPSPTDDWEM